MQGALVYNWSYWYCRCNTDNFSQRTKVLMIGTADLHYICDPEKTEPEKCLPKALSENKVLP